MIKQEKSDLDQYFPVHRNDYGKCFDIILTSCYSGWESPIQELLLSRFDREDTKLYLQSQQFANFNDEIAQQITELLQGLPLAISQAASFVRENKISLQSFCQLYREFEIKEKSKIELHSQDQDSLVFLTTLMLTLEKLRSDNQHVDSLMYVAAFLSCHNLEKDLSHCWYYCLEKQLKEQSEQEGREFQELSSDEREKMFKKCDEGLKLLCSYSLISCVEETHTQQEENSDRPKNVVVATYKVHSLIQSGVRLVLERNYLFNDYLMNVIGWLEPQLDYNEEDATEISRGGLLIPHAIAIIKFLKNPDSFEFIELFEGIARHQLIGVGNYKAALEYFGRTLENKQNWYGKGHSSSGNTLVNIAIAYMALGDYEKAKNFLTRGFELCRIQYGDNHPKTARNLIRLGILFYELGVYERAKHCVSRGLNIYRKHFNEENSIFISSKSILESILQRSKGY